MRVSLDSDLLGRSFLHMFASVNEGQSISKCRRLFQTMPPSHSKYSNDSKLQFVLIMMSCEAKKYDLQQFALRSLIPLCFLEKIGGNQNRDGKMCAMIFRIFRR